MVTDGRKPHIAARVLANLLEEARINVTKPYKPRKIKTDPAHRLKRQVYKIEKMNPTLKRKREKYRKVYERKNKRALQLRREFVQEQRKIRGLD